MYIRFRYLNINIFEIPKMNLIKSIFGIIVIIFFSIKYKIIKINNLAPNHGLNKKLIVSFTSKKSRFYFLNLMISSIFLQTVHPDEIILWIDKREKKYLNKKIIDFKKKGLQIKFCYNLKSYNKIYKLLENKKFYIITFDDDLIYNKFAISKLIKKYKQTNNKYIVSNRIHKITLKNNLPDKYINWNWNSNNTGPSNLNFQTGSYGVLYPPNCFYKDVNNKNIFIKLSPSADDIWLHWMLRMKKKKIIWSQFQYKNYNLINFDKNKLHVVNVGKNRNDKQIQNMIKRYGFPM